jgi:hypothetical protein
MQDHHLTEGLPPEGIVHRSACYMVITESVMGCRKLKCEAMPDPATYLFCLVTAVYRQNELMQKFRQTKEAKID